MKLSDDLISRFYLESGLGKQTFTKIYLDTLKKVESDVSVTEKNIEEIVIALRKRKGIFLPVGIEVEEALKQKDLFTFVVFVSGILLLLFKKEVDMQYFLDKDILSWIATNNEAMSCLEHIHDANSKDKNITKIREIYGMGKESELENLVNIEEAVPEDNINQKTNKDIGIDFLQWLTLNINKSRNYFKVHGDTLILFSPGIFKAFEKEKGVEWKTSQKGLIKLKLHELNDENHPFHKLGGKTAIVINNYKNKLTRDS